VRSANKRTADVDCATNRDPVGAVLARDSDAHADRHIKRTADVDCATNRDPVGAVLARDSDAHAARHGHHPKWRYSAPRGIGVDGEH
jgi:hypothetical protein